MVCTKTLYNYLHKGVLGIKAIDLPLVVRHSQRKSISRKHKRELGKSIELRDSNIETREEFGHWELDTVRGTKDKTDHVLISLLERKSRLYVALRCPSAYPTVASKDQCSLHTFSSTQSMKDSMDPNFIVLNEPRHCCSYVNCPEFAEYTRRALRCRIWITELRFSSI